MKHAVLLIPFALAATVVAWQPAPDSMLTEWGEQVTPENAWREYPRPQMQRDQWTNLNGLWEYAVTKESDPARPSAPDGQILVPFAIESALSGVKRSFQPDDVLWYRRTFELEPRPGRRYLLNFEAVDYQCTVRVNHREVGRHTGGNLPFSLDITEAVTSGVNTVLVRVTDATDTAHQLHGKQRLDPKGIWYTPVSGIWQTVWLEEVPDFHVTGLKITPRIDGTIAIGIATAGRTPTPVLSSAIVSLGDKPVARASGSPNFIALEVPEPKLWSPDSPTLYNLRIQVGDDVVTSYVGIRETGRKQDAEGNWRLTLNGEEIFQFGTLDQGWWPDGLLTPPADAAMLGDIRFLKAAGFNTIRNHIKVKPRRYYLHCDRLGMLIWQDQVSAMADNPKWTRLRPNPETRVWPADDHAQFMAELQGMIDHLYNHPCIVQWVPFNEAWGQHQVMDVGRWVAAYDPTRLVNIASGGNWFPVGHIVDDHKYPHPGFDFASGAGGRFDGYVKVMGEFGGHGFPVEGHLWNPGARNWGYGGLPKDKDEWLERYRTSMQMLGELRKEGIAAGIYTQTTDVEGEINGLLTYDRKVPKVPAETLRAIHQEAGLCQ